MDAKPDVLESFPFRTYAKDGSVRRENITDWALQEFQTHYGDRKISKWDIFYYVYAMLHHPQYRERYATNLRRELPRIPFVGQAFQPAGSGDFPVPSWSDRKRPKRTELESSVNQQAGKPALRVDAALFHTFAAAGQRLADLHVGYEQAKEYPLKCRENPKAALHWRVEKMKLIGRSRGNETLISKKKRSETPHVVSYREFDLQRIPDAGRHPARDV